MSVRLDSIQRKMNAKDRKRFRQRIANSPHFLFLTIRASLVFTLILHRDEFATKKAYDECNLYLVDVLLPRYFFAGNPLNADALKALAEMVVAGFVAVERWRMIG